MSCNSQGGDYKSACIYYNNLVLVCAVWTINSLLGTMVCCPNFGTVTQVEYE